VYPILKKRDLNSVTKLFEVEAPIVARRAEAGNFVIVRVNEKGERIPLTVADFDRDAGTITIVVQEVGKTSALINRMETGDSFADFVGPLGESAPIRDDGHVVCLGGGFGIAPVFPVARALRETGVKVTSIIGARRADLLILQQDMETVSDELLIATDDGSLGHHGFVTEVLQEMIDDGVKIDEVISIGPLPMMRATAGVTRPHDLKTWVSLDSIMVDGTGMCGACRVTVGEETQFCCVDGPFFDAHLVDFDEAAKRGDMYVDKEELAYERFKKEAPNCQCGGGGETDG